MSVVSFEARRRTGSSTSCALVLFIFESWLLVFEEKASKLHLQLWLVDISVNKDSCRQDVGLVHPPSFAVVFVVGSWSFKFHICFSYYREQIFLSARRWTSSSTIVCRCFFVVRFLIGCCHQNVYQMCCTVYWPDIMRETQNILLKDVPLGMRCHCRLPVNSNILLKLHRLVFWKHFHE